MNRRTRAIIAATLVLIGLGVVALGFLEDESSVRYVGELYSRGETMHDGSFTLLGIPQPAMLPDGGKNPEYQEPMGGARSWTDADGTQYITQFAITANQTAPDQWTFSITEWTSTSGSVAPRGAGETFQWVLEGDYQVFQVQDFETGQRAWAAFGGVLNGDIQPKPSQLQGHLEGGAPEGLKLWLVEPDGYTVGCSSKFLPDDIREDYDADGDGYTD